MSWMVWNRGHCELAARFHFDTSLPHPHLLALTNVGFGRWNITFPKGKLKTRQLTLLDIKFLDETPDLSDSYTCPKGIMEVSRGICGVSTPVYYLRVVHDHLHPDGYNPSVRRFPVTAVKAHFGIDWTPKRCRENKVQMDLIIRPSVRLSMQITSPKQ
jgi:hypothetical protein